MHATLLNQQCGETAYRNSRSTSQSPIVRLSAILDFATSFGNIIINRAYGNWQWFEQYWHVLMAGGVRSVASTATESLSLHRSRHDMRSSWNVWNLLRPRNGT